MLKFSFYGLKTVDGRVVACPILHDTFIPTRALDTCECSLEKTTTRVHLVTNACFVVSVCVSSVSASKRTTKRGARETKGRETNGGVHSFIVTSL